MKIRCRSGLSLVAIGLLGPALFVTACTSDAAAGSESVPGGPAVLTLQAPGQENGSSNLDAFAELLLQDGRCSEVYRHFSAVIGIGVDIECVGTYDLLVSVGIIDPAPATTARAVEHIESFQLSADKGSGRAQIYGDYVVVLFENNDSSLSLAVDTTRSAIENQSINELLAARGDFAGTSRGG